MKWIKTLGDLKELESEEELPEEMLGQMRGLLAGMHEAYGDCEKLEDFVLSWETGGPMALLTAEDFGPEGCLRLEELGPDPESKLSESGDEFVEDNRANDGQGFFRLAYVLGNDTCLTAFLTGEAPDPETRSWLEERALIDAESLERRSSDDVPF